MSIGTVNTTLGPVQGVELGGDYAGITRFCAIPYAAPPVGALRFAPPQDPEPWTETRICNQYPDASWQNFFSGTGLYPHGTPKCSEDCLYLNIHTGASSADEKRPVYVWYHDGGLTNGWAYDPRNDMLEFARKGIVCVSVGHRLGEFGYIALPQLTAEQGQSGNYGVMDTLKALQWIHANIAAFGGDPDCITIGGESGGTTKCCALAALPETTGLIRRVINESGLYWQQQPLTQEASEQAGVAYLESVGLGADTTPEQLRAVPDRQFHNAHIDPHFLPGKLTEDGVLYKGRFRDQLLANAAGVDFLNCVCAGEANPKLSPEFLNGAKQLTTAAQFYAHFRSLLGDLYDEYGFESLVSVTDETAQTECLRLAALGLAPNFMSNPARSIMLDRVFGTRKAAMKDGSSVYTARFSHVSDTEKEPGAPAITHHGGDNVYAANSLRLVPPAKDSWTDDDRRVAEIFNEYLANFIRNGNPNGEGLPFWPAGNETMSWMDVSVQPEAHTGMEGRLDELILAYATREYEL